MKKTFTILSFITGIALNAIAQTPGQPIGGIVVKGGKNPGGNTLISISGGITNPSSPTKQNANLANGYAFNANVYVPLFAKGDNGTLAGKTDHFFTIGPNAGGEYFGSSKAYTTGSFMPYNITGQSSSPGLAARESGSPTVQGFKAELGAQANFSFGQVTVSPILNAAYISIKQQAFAIVQSSSVNGQNHDFNLFTQAETKTTGFAFVPKLRVAYFPGKLGLFVEGNYTIGPSIKNATNTLTPQGTADAKGFYSVDQMVAGSNIGTVKTTKYNSLGLNFGLSLPLGRIGRITHGGGKSAKNENPVYQPSGTSGNNPLYQGNLKYANDYSITDQEVLSYLGTNRLVIEKGEYVTDYTKNPFGDITLNLATPVSGKGITEKGIKRQSFTGFRCDTECKEEGTYCWTCKTGKADALFYTFTIKPVIEGDKITRIVLSNTSISIKGVKLTAQAYLAKRGYDYYQARSDVSTNTVQPNAPTDGNNNPIAKEAPPKRVKCDCGKDIYGKDEAACKRICQFLKNGTYSSKSVVFSHEELQEIKNDYLDGLFILINDTKELNPALFKEVTKASDMEGQRASITKNKKSYAFLGNQDDLVKILSIPSARAVVCADCNESDNCENSHHRDCCCNNGVCWCLLCIEKSTLSELPDGAKVVDTNGSTGTSAQPTTANALRPNGTGPKHWWRHRNAVNSCTGNGIYCFTRKFMDDAEIKAFTPAEEDEILTESTIHLANNLITIKSVGVKGNLSANTIKAFKDKKVALTGNYLPFEILEPLFKAIKLTAPKKGIFIKANEQSYSVKVNVVESVEKTKINLGSKTYNLLIISTSEKGTANSN